MILQPPSEVDQRHSRDTVSPTAPTVPTPVGANDHAAQRAWEHYQVDRGIARYHRSLTQETEGGSLRAKRLDEIAVGNTVASDMIGPLVVTIQAKQAEYLEALKDPKLCKVPEDLTALTALPAATIAACAVLTALAASPDATFAGVSRDCATRIQHEIEYAMWKDAEAVAAKERKAANAPFVPDLFKLMVKRNEVVDLRVFKKWAKKSSMFTAGDWDQKTKARIGAVVMTMLVESNSWFEVKQEHQQGHNRVKLMFRMTEMGLGVVRQLHNEGEYQRPFMLPMICEPRDYEYIEPRPEPAPEEALSLSASAA